MHIHVKGDEAAEVCLNAIEAALRKHPWSGHRHVLQHGQMMGRDLFTAWCAVNRQTMSGGTLGKAQCINVQQALYAITMGAAYTLKLDHELGSIETGKRADFAVLGQDPLDVDPMALKDVPVRGTVYGGRVHLL